MRHELKTWPKFYSMVESGRKRFEIRRDDREFAIGDTLVLREYDANAEAYTGKALERTVADIISLRPLYEAVALIFCWHGDSLEATLRAELAAARERLEKAESTLELQKSNNDRLLKEWAESIAELDAALARNTELNQRLATAEAEHDAYSEQCLARCRTLLGTQDVQGVMDGVEQLASRMQRAEADSRRLDKLEAMAKSKDVGNGLAIFPLTSTALGSPLSVISIDALDDEDGSNLGSEIAQGRTIRAAIDAAGGQG